MEFGILFWAGISHSKIWIISLMQDMFIALIEIWGKINFIGIHYTTFTYK